MIEQCATCRFWREDYVEEGVGLCRRHAPRPSHGQFEIEVLKHLTLLSWSIADDEEKQKLFNHWEEPHDRPSYWPATLDIDWCGEFERRREAEKPVP
jgi:hypothetical protein